ncbi:MAG: peptide deformylase [Eubacterium sp.]
MAIRNMRIDDDPILRKKTREITEINDRIIELQKDMLDTMYDQDGVGLAAPQVGVLKKIIVIDIGEGPITLINPLIKEQKGSVIEEEACLSFPDQSGKVERPEFVMVEYTDMDGERYEMKCNGLMARATCHEIDHLNGIVFLDRVIK